MAHTGHLSPGVLRGIASQIGAQLPRERMLAAPGARPALGESLEVVVLPLDGLREGEGSLADRVTVNGQWHHQVYAGRTATDFARSLPSLKAPGAIHRVVEVVASELPQALQHTIEWADEHSADDAEARLLEVPSYLLTGLWLTGANEDSVVIAAMADRIHNLSLNKKIPADEFMRLLAENEPVKGLGLPKRRQTFENR